MNIVEDDQKITELLKNRGMNHIPSLAHYYNRDKDYYLDKYETQCMLASINRNAWRQEWILNGAHLINIYSGTWIFI